MKICELLEAYSEDAALRRRFETDPLSVLDEYDIPEETRDLLRRGDPKAFASCNYPLPAPSPEPWAGCSSLEVFTCKPLRGKVNTDITIEVFGRCIAKDARLSFQKPKTPAVAAYPLDSSNTEKFAFMDQGMQWKRTWKACFSEPGYYEILVTNPDSQQASCQLHLFHVEEPD